MIKARAFRIYARYRRAKKIFSVRRDVLAINENAALEKFFSELGRHGVKRVEITIERVQEIDLKEVKNPRLRKIALADKPVIFM